VSYYWSEDRAFHTLADADIVAMFPNLRQRESDLGAGLVIAEFCDRCFETGASHPDVFALARDALRVLDSAPGAGEPVALSFLLRAGGLLGYAPELGRCIGCRASRAATFSARRGGLLCRRCSALDPDAQPLDAPTLHRLQALKQGTLEQNRQQAVSAAAAGMVLRYLQYHFDRFQLRSLRHQAQSERTGA
jgi:DNA repair protein RecO (recombination protein O)